MAAAAATAHMQVASVLPACARYANLLPLCMLAALVAHLMLPVAAPTLQWNGLLDRGVPGFLARRLSKIQASMYRSP